MRLTLEEVEYLMHVIQVQILEIDESTGIGGGCEDSEFNDMISTVKLADEIQNKLWYIYHVLEGLDIPQVDLPPKLLTFTAKV